MEYVFIDNETNGEYTGGIKITKGNITVGQILAITDDAGQPSKFKVQELEDYDANPKQVKTLGAGKDGFIVLRTLDGKKLAKDPSGGFNIGKTKLENSSGNLTKGGLKGSVSFVANGISWSGNSYYSSSTFFVHGNAMALVREPYLLMSWKATTKPDDRQLTITSKGFKESTGELVDAEILLSGSADGDATKTCMMSNKKLSLAGKKSLPFTINITKWQVNGDIATVSGSFTGTLKNYQVLGIKMAGCDDMKISNGSFENVQIKVHNDTYEQQQKQLGKFMQQEGAHIQDKVNQFLQKEVQKSKQSK
jgi:hypothetical protein